MPTSPTSARREWVAFDLETTGLDFSRDAIIEIGAVRFDADKTLDEFRTFVDPRRSLPPFITQLTGITQRDLTGAPRLAEVRGDFARFLRDATPLAHNIKFDRDFLRMGGIDVAEPSIDTMELASLVRPSAKSYSLSELARELSIDLDSPHRALDDARRARDLFLALMPELAAMDESRLSELRRLSRTSGWDILALLDAVDEFRQFQLSAPSAIGGIDGRELAERLRRPPPITPTDPPHPKTDASEIAAALRAGSDFAAAIPNFEERGEQVDMAAAVASAIDSGSRLIVEAGTGVGKSLAYLLPAALYAVSRGKRVVVSTNTINLQQQLIDKDLPMVKAALASIDPDAAERLRFTLLKGRSNYLCYRRWRQALNSPDDGNRARLVARTLGWLRSTRTGDRGELNIARRDAAAWDFVSAARALTCPSPGGACFLRAARDDAAASHIVVVNHSLLLADIAAGGRAIPDYDVLIVDEAHHLEDVATDQFGFSIGYPDLEDALDRLMSGRGLLTQCEAALERVNAPAELRETVSESGLAASSVAPSLREAMSRLLISVRAAIPADSNQTQYDVDKRIVEQNRKTAAWQTVEAACQDVGILLADLSRSIGGIVDALEGVEPSDMPDRDALLAEVAQSAVEFDQMRSRLAEIVASPSEAGIYWVKHKMRSSDVELHSAPLRVGDTLEESLYSAHASIIMTSATLSANGSLDHIIDRLGFANAKRLTLGSPFDYSAAALHFAPRDLPNPNHAAYQQFADRVIVDAAAAAGGRAMVLFTSYSALNATARAIRAPLSRRGIQALAQGIDGSPRVIAERFLEEPNSVLLGTSSFWEGVDFTGDALSVLIIAKLPFPMPFDPVFMARSEQYRNGFMEYAVPQAILKFKQGFGRLIRSSSDRGVAITLDSRIVNSRYGQNFIASLPKGLTGNYGSGKNTAALVKGWLGRGT